MLSSLKKRSEPSADKTESAKSASTNAEEFLPFFGHLRPHVLVTKDGQVLQTICIRQNRNGLDYELPDKVAGNLRECIRRAIVKHVPTDNVAIWIHTLRKRQAVAFNTHYDNAFAAHVNKGWRSKHGWTHRYYNEVYVTLVYEGQSSNLTDKYLLKEGMTPQRNRIMRDTYLEAAANELDLMMESIIDELAEQYRVQRLSVVERVPTQTNDALPNAPIFYSEPMEFLFYLLNLRQEEVPLPEAAISTMLQSTDLIFGFNAMETKGEDGSKRFGALLSLKQYREAPSHTVDMLLQAPVELIITQAFHFIPADVALKEYRAQKDFFEVSNDTYSMEATGLLEMLRMNRNTPIDFGWHQTTIMVLTDELKKIDDEIRQLQSAFSNIGLVCVREDVRLEEIFWSTFPGNFVFLRRKSAIPTTRIGGFAKLNRFASGQSEHLFWNEPITLVPTLVNSPYFFNFHQQDNGHILWLDFNSFNDRVANQSLAFLITQSQKLHPRVYYVDYHRSAALWFNKMGASYHVVRAKAEENPLAINPFSLEPDARNLSFLTAWCGELVAASAEDKAQIRTAIEALYHTQEIRNFSAFLNVLAQYSPALAARFAPWDRGGAHAHLFAAQEDVFSSPQSWMGLDITEACATAENAVAVFAYLLHRMVLTLDGQPTIIVVQHAFPLLQQPFFASRLDSLLEMLRENNTIMIASVRYGASLANHPVMEQLMQSCASTIIVPDDLPLDYPALLPALFNAEDQELLSDLARMQGDLMLKRGRETVALRINLENMPDVTAIFDNDIKTLISAGGPFATLPPGVRGSHA